jgi:hypothetical protein
MSTAGPPEAKSLPAQRSEPFASALGLRLKPAIREQIRRIAASEGNTEAAVLRRAVAVGLSVIDCRLNEATS